MSASSKPPAIQDGDNDDAVQQESLWTTNHHLVGNVVTRSLLCPLEWPLGPAVSSPSAKSTNDNHYYQLRSNTVLAVAFSPEDVQERKPALWRALIRPSSSVNTDSVCRALDFVAADWQQSNSKISQPAALPSLLTGTVKERLNSVLYKTVVQDLLPKLVLTAAVEECQAQWLQQTILSQQQQPQPTTQTSLHYSSTPFPYYKQSPNSYLAQPSQGSTNNTNRSAQDEQHEADMMTLPVQFTPSALVQRIKQGCTLAWQDYQRRYPVPQPPVPATTPRSATPRVGAGVIDSEFSSTRRLSSRRVARQQVHEQLQAVHKNHDQQEQQQKREQGYQDNVLWKVMPGGKVATVLYEQLVLQPEKITKDDEELTVDKHHETLMQTEEEPSEENDPAGEEPVEATGEKGLPTETTEKIEAAEEQPAEMAGVLPVADADNDTTMLDEDESKEGGDGKSADESYAPANDDGNDDDEDDDAGDYVKESADILDVELNEEPHDKEDDNGEQEGGDDNDDENEEVEEEEEEDVDLVLGNNPYLQPAGSAVLEWLGRKTAKHLASADIQQPFASMLPPPKAKKTKKKISLTAKQMSNVGCDALKLLSLTDQLIWGKMLPHGAELIGPGARILLQIVNDEDTSKIVQWEASTFGRTLFTMRIWNGAAQAEIDKRAFDAYVVADMEYKEKKAWGSWRYKGINGGYTVWPSWLEAVDEWRKKHGPATSSQPTETEECKQSQDDDGATKEDLALAQLLTEQDVVASSAGTRRSRRSAEGGGGGVFYGSQSNMTQKQLMDAILRLVSQNSYQTVMGLVQSISDDSTDPLRRIRQAVGKLLCKRNQLARMIVQPSWSDKSIRETLFKSALVDVDEEKEKKLASPFASADEKKALVDYIKDLHKTELRLRQLVLEHLVDIPIAIVATSADERPNSMEAVDEEDFVDAAIEWHTSGHDLLNKVIYRPPATAQSDSIAPCEWYCVRDFSDPVASTEEDADASQERPQIGLAREATTVKRRRRFRASRTASPELSGNGTMLILTEAQVHAGLKAAEMEKKRASTPQKIKDNPFAGSKSPQIALIPPEGSGSRPLSVSVVGHDTIVNANNVLCHRILVLPDEESSQNDAVWARLAFPESGTTECQIDGDAVVYTLQQNDYHSSSPAFQECRSIVNFAMRHSKAVPFLEPVDPVALNVPDYPNLIKNPMDLGTLSSNLESGKYSNIPPKEAKGQSPIACMLNGPFRRDLELIFDNAMLFNPPEDWIHQAAFSLKKAILRKLDQAANASESKSHGRSREKHSVYVDEDSDVDMYEYESDQDEDYNATGRRRKRKHTSSGNPIKEDSSARLIERPTRLQKVLSDSMGLRGPLANIPVNSDASMFALPHGWGCRRSQFEASAIPETPGLPALDTELEDLIGLHRAMQEDETGGLRRSTRAHHADTDVDTSNNSRAIGLVEYYETGSLKTAAGMHEEKPLPRSRFHVELACETMHEEYYAKLYQKMYKALDLSPESVGSFADGSFPPYLGHVVPTEPASEPCTDTQRTASKWEIREVYLVPAIRWVIRGLIRSDHLSELESLDVASDSGVILPNHVYYLDPEAEPFDVLDVRELSRRKKRANDKAAAESSDEEVELSAYEKLRAERVARNAERLKALGLA